MTLHGGIDNPSVFSLNSYRIRRKLLKIFGASFHIYDGDEVVGFSRKKAFKLKEDIRVFPDEYSSEEILSVQARQHDAKVWHR
jgi:hypothetical protein